MCTHLCIIKLSLLVKISAQWNMVTPLKKGGGDWQMTLLYV